MDPRALDHCLTPAEWRQFDEKGYLIVEDALDAAALKRVTAAVDALYARKRTAAVRDIRQMGVGFGPHDLFSQTDFLKEDDTFLDLLDWPRTFPKVWGILGWNIYLYHAHVDITPHAEPGRTTDAAYRAWHQDSMRVNDEIECRPRPRLSLKIAFFLTDTTQTNRGNMWVCPGSQRFDELTIAPGSVDPAGAIPLCGRAGTAVIFDRRIWHSRSLNTSDVTRKGVFLGYSYRWLQPKDEMEVKQLFDRSDPVRRQVLGDRLSANGYYDPQDGDVPLRAWLSDHGRLDTAGMWQQGKVMGKPPK